MLMKVFSDLAIAFVFLSKCKLKKTYSKGNNVLGMPASKYHMYLCCKNELTHTLQKVLNVIYITRLQGLRLALI